MSPRVEQTADVFAAAVEAWRRMFGVKIPANEADFTDALFYQASEQANLVTMTVRRHGYEPFVTALKRALLAQGPR